MSKEKIAEELADKLQDYASEVEERKHDNFYDDYIVDELLDMREILFEDGVQEGHLYQSHTILTDNEIKLYDVVESQAVLSGDVVNLKVMSIESVTPSVDAKMIVEFLGKIVKFTN